MLDIMRRKKRLKAVLWLVILSLGMGMLLLFVPGQNVGVSGFDASAASVDGEAISMKEFASTYRRVVDSYSAGGRNKTDLETLKALGLHKQALDALINVRVVNYAGKRLGLDVSPEEIRRVVETNPNFQDRGVFVGVERYKALLAANNISVTDFEDSMRYMLMSRKIRDIVSDSLDVTDRELRDEFVRANQEAQVQFVLLKKDDYKKKAAPTDANLRAYFEANKDKYHIKEQRRAQYLLISISDIAASVPVSEREIQDEWNRQSREENVDASHILFKVPEASKDAEIKAKAEGILKRAKAGEDFAKLAEKYSEDPSSAKQGGNLGPFTRGRMVKEFEDVAFSLKPGDISGLVHTQFGYHIIKVLRHETPTLESSRQSLVRSIQLNKASDLVRQKALEAQKLAETQKDLNAIAKALNIPTEIKDTGLLDKASDPLASGISPQTLDEIFRLKEINAVGRAVEHPMGYALPKLVETQLPKPPEFGEVRAAVEKDFVETKADELMREDAKKLAEEASKTRDLEATAKRTGHASKASLSFKRDAVPDPDIPGAFSQFNAAAFELPVGGVSAPIPLDGGNKSAILQVKSRTPFSEEEFTKQKTEIRERLLNQWRDAYFQEYIRKVTESLEKSGKIRINSGAVEQALGFRS